MEDLGLARLKPKTGRRAGLSERQKAQFWVDLYREAQAQPEGRLCVNPEDEPEIQAWVDGNDPKYLLSVLDDFARNGTFELVGDTYDAIARLPMRMRFRKLRAAGSTYDAAVFTLSEEYNVSTRTMESWLRTEKT